MSNTLEDGRLAIRVPRVITPATCIERCGRLRNKIGQALGQAAAEGLTAFPAQRAVVCGGAARLACHAETVNEGFVESDITAGGSPDRLSVNPTNPSPTEIIAAAIENGATEHTVAEIFKR